MPSPYLRGLLLIAAGAVILSTFGLMVRFITATSPWELVFWRSLGVVLAVAAILLARHRAAVPAVCRAAGATALAGGLFLAGGFAFFILAITHTSVGATLFTISICPFVAALLGWVALGERVAPGTWLAAAAAFGGVAIMFLGSLEGGDSLGQVFGLATAVCGAAYVVLLRRGRGADMTVAVGLGGLFAMLLAVVPAWPLDAPLREAAFAVAIGVLQNGIGQALIAAGSREVPASQIALLGLIEVVLGPFWVWIAVGEQLTGHTALGGAIILAAVVGNARLAGNAAGRAPRPALRRSRAAVGGRS